MTDTPREPEIYLRLWKGREPFVATPNKAIVVTFAGRLAIHNHVVLISAHTGGLSTPDDYLRGTHSTSVNYLREIVHLENYRLVAGYMIRHGYPAFLNMPQLPPYVTRHPKLWAIPRTPPLHPPANLFEWTSRDEADFEALQQRAREPLTGIVLPAADSDPPQTDTDNGRALFDYLAEQSGDGAIDPTALKMRIDALQAMLGGPIDPPIDHVSEEQDPPLN